MSGILIYFGQIQEGIFHNITEDVFNILCGTDLGGILSTEEKPSFHIKGKKVKSGLTQEYFVKIVGLNRELKDDYDNLEFLVPLLESNVATVFSKAKIKARPHTEQHF